MKKRLRKKGVYRYPVLKCAQREKTKRKGKRCVQYELVQMGPNDQFTLATAGYEQDYSSVTHWFIQLNEMKEKFPVRNAHYNAIHYLISVYPCNDRGNTIREFALYLHFVDTTALDEALAIYNTQIEAMKNDQFWEI